MVDLTTKKREYHGYAMHPLATNSLTLNVFSPELFPGGMAGDFVPSTTTSPTVTVDESGVTRTSNVVTSNHITAVWKSESGSLYPSTVAKGEQVKLYQTGDSDKWYWDTIGRDSELRTTDRQRDYVSATPNANEQKDDTNSYFSEKDSINKRFTIARTSKANGEPVAIFTGIDTAAGVFVITDDKGVTDTTDPLALTTTNPSNMVILDFVNNIFQFTNNDKSTIQINKQDIIVEAARDLFLKAGRQIITDSPATTVNRGEVGSVVINGEHIALNAASSAVITATVLGINAVTKVSKALCAALVRVAGMVTGAVGSAYTPTTIDLDAGKASPPTNTVDDNTDGAGDRHLAAWEDVNKAFAATAQAISEVAKAVPTGVSTDGITSRSENAIIDILKGA